MSKKAGMYTRLGGLLGIDPVDNEDKGNKPDATDKAPKDTGDKPDTAKQPAPADKADQAKPDRKVDKDATQPIYQPVDDQQPADQPAPQPAPAPQPDPQPVVDQTSAQPAQPKEPTSALRPVSVLEYSEGGRNMKSLEFYEQIGNDIFDYDRGLQMGDSLKSWMKTAIPDDPDLAYDFIARVFPELLKKNPELIEVVKEVVKKTQTDLMPFVARWVETGDHEHAFANYDEAKAWEAATYAGKVNAFQEGMFVTKQFLRKEADGSLTEVSLDEVKAFYEAYEGDKQKMLDDLGLKVQQDRPKKPDKKKGNGGKGQSKKDGPSKSA